MLKKIVILGPESTGKSFLSNQLAKHYNTLWCPEFARNYLISKGINYTYEDLLEIAKGQLELENKYTQKIQAEALPKLQPYRLLFIDTDMYVMKVWSEFVFNKCHKFILDNIATRKYDLYLLCKPDLPWVDDELREYPDLKTRERLYRMYQDLMINQSVPWVEISGDYDTRLKKAIEAVDRLLLK